MAFDCRCPFTPIGEYEIWTVYPEEGAIIYEPEVTLIWSYSTGYGARGGIFYIDAGTSFSDLYEIGYTYDTTYVYTSLDPSTTYFWRIDGIYRPAGGGLENEFSDIASFTTADEFYEPGQVHSPSPDSGAIGVSVNPSFSWEVYNPDLTPYDFDIYLGTTTDPPLLASRLSAPSYRLLGSPLDYATHYYWRVEAYYGVDTVKGPLWEFTTDYPSGVDVFGLFEVDARQAPSGYHAMEEIRARFDTGVAIVTPIEPLEADSVFVEGVKLNWNAMDENYSYIEWSLPFIENGQSVDIDVYGNTDVPSLNTDFIFPDCALGITDPESFETVSITGFEVSWSGSDCGGTVWLTLMDGNDSTGVWKEVANDGLDSLTATDLIPLGGQTGQYNLAIIKYVEENISAPGYRSESLIRAKAYNVMEQINISSK
jgi:hypothetical protein